MTTAQLTQGAISEADSLTVHAQLTEAYRRVNDTTFKTGYVTRMADVVNKPDWRRLGDRSRSQEQLLAWLFDRRREANSLIEALDNAIELVESRLPA